jgi:hypothetical protein
MGSGALPDGTEPGSDMDVDSFGATDAAAGPDEIGREKR